MQVVPTERPRLIEQVVMTRKEVAQVLRISPREFDRVRKTWHFTEIYVVEGPKGLRFLGFEVEEYIWQHASSTAS